MNVVWSFDIVQAADVNRETSFKGKRHVYSNLWIAQFWNNWRALRILVHGYLIDLGPETNWGGCESEHSVHTAIIREMSEDLCTSAPSIVMTSRKPAMIERVSQTLTNDLQQDLQL